MSIVDSTGLSYYLQKLKGLFVRSVNGEVPNPSTGNVVVSNVATADNLTSPDAQASYGTFIYRTSGGSANISSGEANLVYINGKCKIDGAVTEALNLTTVPVFVEEGPLFTTDLSMWRNTVYGVEGTYDFTYTRLSNAGDTHWQLPNSGNYVTTLENYGIYVVNNSIKSRNIEGLTDSEVITDITINIDTWESQITSGEGNYIFTYQNNYWYLNGESISPYTLTDYGITLTTSGTITTEDYFTIIYQRGTPDFILKVTYIEGHLGTIHCVQPTSFQATGFNQFDNETMYIANATIDDGEIIENTGTFLCYCKAVGNVDNGYVAYSQLGYIENMGWCATLPEIGSEVSIISSNVSSILSSVEFANDGYVVVVVSNKSDLCIHPKWSGIADTTYAAYEAPSVITFPLVGTRTGSSTEEDLPLALYGMPAINTVTDTLNLDTDTYIQRIGYLPNTDSNLEAIIALGVDYIYDENSIYYVLTYPIVYTVNATSDYIVNDFGTEEFIGTDIPIDAQLLYGQNLRDKLRIDVVTISPQELNDTQKLQVRQNIGALSTDSLIREDKTYYVSPNGNDDNDGSINYPFKTILKAITVTKGYRNGSTYGVTINLAAGTYTGDFTIWGYGPRLSLKCNGNVIINGGLYFTNCNFISFQAINSGVDTITINGERTGWWTHSALILSDNTYCEFLNFASATFITPTRTNNDTTYNTVHVTNNSTLYYNWRVTTYFKGGQTGVGATASSKININGRIGYATPAPYGNIFASATVGSYLSISNCIDFPNPFVEYLDVSGDSYIAIGSLGSFQTAEVTSTTVANEGASNPITYTIKRRGIYAVQAAFYGSTAEVNGAHYRLRAGGTYIAETQYYGTIKLSSHRIETVRFFSDNTSLVADIMSGTGGKSYKGCLHITRIA